MPFVYLIMRLRSSFVIKLCLLYLKLPATDRASVFPAQDEELHYKPALMNI